MIIKLFRDKKITLMGLGLLGRGIGVAKFLLKNGAKLTITDLKSKEDLASSLAKLKSYKKNITYVLGEHRLKDFQNKDFIIKAAGVPLDSSFIAEARRNKIPIEMDASLFAKLAPKGVIIIGITGTRGKSTTTHLIYSILQKAGKKVFLGGNVRGLATLPLLEKVKAGDFVVLELDSWQLQGFGEAQISPQVAVFTNLMLDHQNYYQKNPQQYFADKANIYLYQKKSDILVAGAVLAKKIKKEHGRKIKSKIIVASAADLPNDWKLQILGEHNRENAALAMKAAEALAIPKDIIKKALENFPGLEGRLQFVGEKNGIKIYNDNNATTPDATLAALKSLSKNKNIILIMGGADKNLEISKLIKALPKYCKAVILLAGSGTKKIKGKISGPEMEKIEDTLASALEKSQPGDIILFSPAFASFSKYFQNEYERNDLFMKVVKGWLKN